jgi:cytochrome c biogenesis protein CcdA
VDTPICTPEDTLIWDINGQNTHLLSKVAYKAATKDIPLESGYIYTFDTTKDSDKKKGKTSSVMMFVLGVEVYMYMCKYVLHHISHIYTQYIAFLQHLIIQAGILLWALNFWARTVAYFLAQKGTPFHTSWAQVKRGQLRSWKLFRCT